MLANKLYVFRSFCRKRNGVTNNELFVTLLDTSVSGPPERARGYRGVQVSC
jgi:hypothetical protein